MRPREETEDRDVLRITALWEERVVEDVAVRIFVPTEGVRLRDRAVRPDPLDLNDSASMSFPGRSVLAGQFASLRDPCVGNGGIDGGFRFRVRVESSSPLNASRSRRPSASTSSIWCRISCTDSTVSSSGTSAMLMWVYEASTPFEPWNEDGGALRLPDRVRVREDVPGSVALKV